MKKSGLSKTILDVDENETVTAARQSSSD